MKCPSCGNLDSKVVDSRYVPESDSIRRRRECTYCGQRFTTYEYTAKTPLIVKKKDGRREPFSEEKMRNGIILACRKRPVSYEDIERIVKRVISNLRDLDTNEVESRTIGRYVMDALLEVDEVAYVRFASVYEEFGDIESFIHAVERVANAKYGSIKTERKGGE